MCTVYADVNEVEDYPEIVKSIFFALLIGSPPIIFIGFVVLAIVTVWNVLYDRYHRHFAYDSTGCFRYPTYFLIGIVSIVFGPLIGSINWVLLIVPIYLYLLIFMVLMCMNSSKSRK